MKTIYSLFFIGLFLCSCKVESYEDVLEIEFKSLSFEEVSTPLGIETKAILVFSFIDGNGNIGARERDMNGTIVSLSKIHYFWKKKLPDGSDEPYGPLEIEIWKQDGLKDTVRIEGTTAIPYNQVMNKDEAHNKTLKGTMEIALFTPLNLPSDVDIMRIRFYIVDRNGKGSVPKGVERTSEEPNKPVSVYTCDFNKHDFDSSLWNENFIKLCQ